MFTHSRKFTTFAFVLAALASTGCVAASKHAGLKQEMERTQNQLLEAEEALARAEDYILQIEGQGQEADALRAQLEEMRARMADMQAKSPLPNIDGAEGIYDPRAGGYGYRLAGDVTFSPGSANLTKQGESILKDVAAQLKKHAGEIRIDGHTDTDPVKKTADKWPDGNIQLGAGRAIAVQKFLISQGVPEEKVFIASYASFRPAVEGKSSEAKQKNRRVEVLMLLEPAAAG